MFSTMSRLNKEFDSSEHQSLGNIKLSGLPAEYTHFTFPGGARLTFGEIIALAGDYFGISLDPISLGVDKEEKQKRFLAAYATLANCSAENVYNLTNEFVIEARKAESAIADGKAESEGIDEITIKETAIALANTKGQYLTLAEHNLDHFNTEAHKAFWTGYELAMDAAIAAAKLPDRSAQNKMLEYAYTLLAFACHFMTDLFASGHMRTPRADLEAQFGAEIGSLLSLFQHNEDGDRGLEVMASAENGNLVTWHAYGDGHLFEKKSKENQDRALAAVQVVVNEIYHAFLYQQIIPQNLSALIRLIPTVTPNNHPPMFKLGDNGKLLCRIPFGSELKNEYSELTPIKALEILTYHAKNYVDESISQRINSFKEKLEGEAKKIEDDFKQLPSLSIFARSKPMLEPQAPTSEKTPSRCHPCTIL